ncbi:hypothetical protein E4P41_11975 [Geodermatophilus sp. DF01-2]|uniref:hypothetical protein n=1 Tax=Geodermatophilus sp. DF01-2 TaxID=2559610 RepID=UPI0010737DA2|nr:hypothetical protein [Geodermatophilus sp. DF01_2]TFV59285.1 hypothetical protein E4P41_11975 [Geodermatophilus sp. DF01_2]
MGTADDGALWPTRYLTGGQLVVARSPRREPGPAPSWARLRDAVVRLDWLDAIGRWWLRLSGEQKLVLGLALFLSTAGIGLVVPLAGVAVHQQRREKADSSALPMSSSAQAALAAWDTTEARVAAAASRAWAETVREPAWHSPFLAHSRAAFDGQAEVDQVVDLALRIRQARVSLGLRPAGPAAEYWDRQAAALETAARQLGRRADALIRYRDQAAQLSAELRQLTDLERLERSAAEIDGLTVDTASPSGRGDGGIGGVAEDIAAVRMAMTELVDLMTRTRAPLAEPPDGARYQV